MATLMHAKDGSASRTAQMNQAERLDFASMMAPVAQRLLGEAGEKHRGGNDKDANAGGI